MKSVGSLAVYITPKHRINVPMLIFVSSWEASSTLLTNGNYEYRESVVENGSPVAWSVAGPATLDILFIDLYVEHSDHTILSISVYI